jgi:peptidoglycan/xylan/chitin deacetylase (PgdA/CDA1 family)
MLPSVERVRRGDRGSIPIAHAVVSLLLALLLVGLPDAPAAASGVITHGPQDHRWVALTFDDGWGVSACERISRTLRAKGATATFLINGSILRGSPSRWRAILRGFPLANHTRTHPWLTRLGSADIRAQIVTDAQAHQQVLGRPTLPLLRPPYGAYDSDVLRVAGGLGYRTILWNTSGGDTAAGATTASVIRNATRGGSGAIVLLHCGPSMTPAAVGPIIDSYRARGYRLVGLDEMLGLAPPSPTACRVRDRDTGVVKASLQAAVDAAHRGDRLTVRGRCTGSTLVDRSLTITGIERDGSGPPTLVTSGSRRVLTVPAGVTVTLSGLTIRGGGGVALGGGIRNAGTLTLSGSSVRDSEASAQGGGVHNTGSLRLAGGTTVTGNRADAGGGIWSSGTLTLADGASVTGNRADVTGGGLWSSGTLDGVRCAPEPDPGIHDNQPDDCVLVAPPPP